MDHRLVMIAASALGFATTAAAEPAKTAPSTPSQERARPVVLASAEVPPSPSATASEAPSPSVPARKPRAARVTSCRCADTPNP